MNRHICAFAVFALLAVACGGSGGGGSEPLTPRGGDCGIAPVDTCRIDAKRSDEDRFNGLNSLAKKLLSDSHPLHNSTFVGGDPDHPIGQHVESVAVMMSTWDMAEKSDEARAVRRRPDGDLHNVAERLRCAADRLIKLGPDAETSGLVCWSLELWRVGRAYSSMAAK
jgi:hypothetical protein